MLNALTDAGLAKRTVRKEKIDVGSVTTAEQPKLVYELTASAAPLAQMPDDGEMQGKPARLLCFGRVDWDGNVRREMVSVQRDTWEGFIFHGSESDDYPAFREDNGVVVSRLSYALQFVPSPYAKEHEKAYGAFFDDAFRTRKVVADVVNDGKGWVIANSTISDRQ